ncbi:cysteine-rich RLK (RECEPTOR-like protein kinase)40 [Striga asiatica]|uniref:Cysteine-rich RLK (RECEPTOR-like protein kinase)40 n=1 Tax=Striga asiatica TaxID=4170 RepID=A0A5A7RHD3_STRAF|nr:cysteine-rich RLK (RECEPTOR-like protein kinase)40 [Striga asiatica]
MRQAARSHPNVLNRIAGKRDLFAGPDYLNHTTLTAVQNLHPLPPAAAATISGDRAGTPPSALRQHDVSTDISEAPSPSAWCTRKTAALPNTWTSHRGLSAASGDETARSATYPLTEETGSGRTMTWRPRSTRVWRQWWRPRVSVTRRLQNLGWVRMAEFWISDFRAAGSIGWSQATAQLMTWFVSG